MTFPGVQPDWMMENDKRERIKEVYVTLETIEHDKKATEMPMLMIRKGLDQNLPGIQENQSQKKKPLPREK
jgi:hypothetical protein